MDIKHFPNVLLDTSDINSGVRGAGVNLWVRTEFWMSGAATVVVS